MPKKPVRDQVNDMARAARKSISRLTPDRKRSWLTGCWSVAVREHPEFKEYRDLFFQLALDSERR